jgi:ankyrin repeat protein
LLVRAVTEDDKEAIPVLLKLGADPNAQSTNRIPALVVAMEQALQGKATPATVRVLLDGGANPNFLLRPEFGRGSEIWFGYAAESTPLAATVSRAALPGFEEAQLQIVRTLLQRGADPALVDNDGETALSRAEQLDEAEPTRRELRDVVGLIKNAGAQ